MTKGRLTKDVIILKAICVYKDKSTGTLDVSISREGSRTVAMIPKELVSREIEHINLMPEYLTASVGEEGYMVVPFKTLSAILCRFEQREDAQCMSGCSFLPIFGMKRNQQSILAIVTGMTYEYMPVVGVKNGRYYLYPRFILDGDGAYEDIVVEYHDMPGADYSEMAGFYRRYQLEVTGCVPLRERIIGNDELRYAAEAVEVRIRLGWKPVPPPVLEQTLENEPPMKVACTFAKVGRIMEEFRKHGVEKAEICLVGWNRKGHDGRWPQAFPVEEQLGGEKGLLELVDKAKELGYKLVCHSNNTGAYKVSELWDEEYIAKNKDGSLMTRPSVWSGGKPHVVCPQRAYELFALNDLPRIAALGFRGIHYIDVLTVLSLPKCYDSEHPVNRRQAADYYNRIMKMAQELFGGVASEGAYDFAAKNLDYVYYTGNSLFSSSLPLCDEIIPLWQLVYHGIILYNPSVETTNYILKDRAFELKFIEYGGRPAIYYYSKFTNRDAKGNPVDWSTFIDARCDTEEEMVKSVENVRKTYDQYKQLAYLQYEFMERHEKVSDGVYKVTYSDGTVITVDYNNETYEVVRPAG